MRGVPRFHLSTLLAASFVAAILMWLNVIKHQRLIPLERDLSYADFGLESDYGWPMVAQFSWVSVPMGGLVNEKDEIHDVRIFPRKFFKYERSGPRWNFWGICVDALVFIVVIVFTFLILERFVVRTRSN